MNKNLLRSEMVKHGDTGGTLAAFLGISPGTLSNKMNERDTEFTKAEMDKIRERYSLTGDSFIAIFFADIVS